jgi:cysteine desulfurase
MLGNNETGAMQPIVRLAAICDKAGTLLHTDGAQSVGKIPVHFRQLGVAAMTVAAHKFHGPRGIGALILRHGVELKSQLFGGFQQAGHRPGTEDVALAVGMHTALLVWQREADDRTRRMTALRDRLEHQLRDGWPDLVVHAAGAPRLPHTLCVAFPGLNRQALVMALDLAGVACSTGSACASGASDPSPTLVAMGCENAVLEGSIRLSLGATTTAADIDEAARRILLTVNNLARTSGAGIFVAQPRR